MDFATAEFSVIDNEIESSFSCARLFCPERQTITGFQRLYYIYCQEYILLRKIF